MASKPAAFQFVDSHPARGSKRDQELIRSDARSHAAKVAARRRKEVPAEQKEREAADTSATQFVQALPRPPTTQNAGSITAATPDSTTTSVGLPERCERTQGKYSQKDVPFHRFRLATTVRGKAASETSEMQHREVDPRSIEDTAHKVVSRSFIPKLAGNSDPFNTTVIRLSPVEHILLQQSRDQLIWAVWPSEIMIRRNKDAIIHSSWKIAPPTEHDQASNYALVAQAYFSRGARQRVAGLPADKGLIKGEKYKFQALRKLQEQLEVNRQSPGDPKRLRGIFLACCWLSSVELLCQNWEAAELHYKAMRTVVDLSGGWGAFSRMEREILVTAATFLATGKRARPVIEIDDFDPGHWHEYKIVKPLPADGLDLDIPAGASVSTMPALTAVSPRLRRFFEEIKELLAVEEIKLQHARSKKPSAVHMFRWSHARRIAVRGRSLHYWCDLLEEAKANGATVIVPIGTPLAVTFDFALCIATRCFDRCIFDDHYQPGGVYAESRRYHMELLSVMQALRPVADDYSIVPDEHTFDVLWIYSIGAYVEDVFMQPELEKIRPLQAPPLPPFARRFFSSRFSYLAAANLQFTSFEDISRFLGDHYLYCPRMQDQSLQKLVSFTAEELTIQEVLNNPPMVG